MQNVSQNGLETMLWLRLQPEDVWKKELENHIENQLQSGNILAMKKKKADKCFIL